MSDYFARIKVRAYDDSKYPFLEIFPDQSELSVEIPNVLYIKYIQAKQDLDRYRKEIVDYIEAHQEMEQA